MTLSSRGRRLRAPAVAVCSAVLLLAGCGSGAQPDEPARDKAATEQPVAAPVADAAARVDWKAAAYAALDCTPRTEWLADGLPAAAWDDETVRTTAADVTGDGVDEILVQATCPAAASTPADHVVVFDVTGAAPDLLGVLGDELFHPRATLSLDGTTVTLSGPTVAGDDPSCCPGHRGTVSYAWDGVRFVVAARSEVPGSSPAATPLPDGEHVGLLLSVGPDEVVVDVVEWFEGDAARAACRADGVPVDESAWCTQYYVRGAGDGGVPVQVSADAPLRYLDLETMDTVALGDVAELAGTPWVSENPDAGGYTRFRTADGVITAMEGIYTP